MSEQNQEIKVDDTPQANQAKSSSGLSQNLAGLICYLGGFITGIIFFLIEKENRFVRFHAAQSIVLSAALIAISIATMIINLLLGWTIIIPLLIGFLSIIFYIGVMVLWIFLMVKAYQGAMFKLPLLGKWSDQLADKQF